jgi:hypothetical protein
MRSFFLRIIVIERCSIGGFPLEEASEHCFLSIKVLFWCCGFIYYVVPLLFSVVFMFFTIIIDLVLNTSIVSAKRMEGIFRHGDVACAA